MAILWCPLIPKTSLIAVIYYLDPLVLPLLPLLGKHEHLGTYSGYKALRIESLVNNFIPCFCRLVLVDKESIIYVAVYYITCDIAVRTFRQEHIASAVLSFITTSKSRHILLRHQALLKPQRSITKTKWRPQAPSPKTSPRKPASTCQAAITRPSTLALTLFPTPSLQSVSPLSPSPSLTAALGTMRRSFAALNSGILF